MPQEWGTLLKRKPTKHTLLIIYTNANLRRDSNKNHYKQQASI